MILMFDDVFFPLVSDLQKNPARTRLQTELQDVRRLAKAKKNIVHDFFQTCAVQQLWFSACIIFTDFILTALFNCKNKTNGVYETVTFE